MRPALVQPGYQTRRQECCDEEHTSVHGPEPIAASSDEMVSMQKGELDEQVKELSYESIRAAGNSAKE